MSDYEKAFIYFDTNALECRHSGKSLFLSQFTMSPLYYKIEEAIRNMELSEKVKICIPEIVWFELQEHLVSHYKSEKDSMNIKIESFRKSFGNLCEITYNFRDCNTETKYIDYVASIAQDFLNNPKITATIIPCPKDEDTIQKIIGQAVRATKPFRKVKSNGKEYTDAGFKDALIFNTILKHTSDQLGIFVSNDNDFSELFTENSYSNIKKCSNEKEVIAILSTEFSVVSTDMIESILKSDDYLIRRILTETEFDEASAYEIRKIMSTRSTDEGVYVIFAMTVNGEKYIFEITYNIEANELIEAFYELPDENEVL